MKLLCDFCERNPASLICCADEAALCLHCDVQVHAANKIASKHERINLLGLPNNSKDPPPCDICQEKNGYFFCLEDRALLCRNCDFSIHTVNNIVSKHRRFVVMGTRVALHPLQAPTNQTTTNASADISPLSMVENSQYSGHIPSFHSNSHSGQSPSFHSNSDDGQVCGGVVQKRVVINGQLINGINTFYDKQNKESILLAPKSSIGKYLTEIIPGWQVDELLTSPQSLTTESDFFSSYIPRSKDCASVRDVGFNGAPAEVPEMHSLELPCSSSIEMMMMTMRPTHMHPYISLPPNTPHDNALQVPVLGVHHAHHHSDRHLRQ